MNNTTFYIVRHGETIGNAQKIIQGQTDTPLTEKGKEQALAIREELSHINFAAAYSSDLGRAITSAEIIIAGKEIRLLTSPLLRERKFGKYETFLYAKMAEEQKELHSEFDSLPREKRRSYKFAEDIECDEEIAERFNLFIQQTASENKGKNVLVISHGGLMKAVLLEFHYGDYNEILKGRFGNTGLIKLTVDEKVIRIDEIKGFKFD